MSSMGESVFCSCKSDDMVSLNLRSEGQIDGEKKKLIVVEKFCTLVVVTRCGGIREGGGGGRRGN